MPIFSPAAQASAAAGAAAVLGRSIGKVTGLSRRLCSHISAALRSLGFFVTFLLRWVQKRRVVRPLVRSRNDWASALVSKDGP